MANTKVDVCNMALRHLSNETIDNFDTDQTPQAQACREFYEQAKDDLLTEFTWFFAQKQANLARLTTTPLFTWDYEYQLPSDLLRIERVLASTQRPAPNPPYEVMEDKILTNEQQVPIVYTFKVPDSDTAKMPSLFKKILSFDMAILMAPGLASNNLVAKLVQQREIATDKAIPRYAAQRRTGIDDVPDNDWTRRGFRDDRTAQSGSTA
jgi:hypothetical protein